LALESLRIALFPKEWKVTEIPLITMFSAILIPMISF
jgi:hypothetical protein